MLPASTRDVSRYTPDEYSATARTQVETALASAASKQEKESLKSRLVTFENPPVYLIGIASQWGKLQIRRAVIAAGVRIVERDEILDSLQDAVNVIVESRQHDDLLDLIAAVRDVDIEAGDALEKDDERRFKELTTLAHQHYPPYADLLALDAGWWPMMKYFSAAHMLRGWENVKTEFKMQNGIAADECLNAISESHLEEIGMEAIRLMTLTETEKKS